MDTDKRNEFPEWETKDFVIYGKTVGRVSLKVYWFPKTQISQGDMEARWNLCVQWNIL